MIDKINSGYNISTMIKKNDRWFAGARVEIVNLKGTSYIRTNCDSTVDYNLENLPKF